jgi:hypothetical protein
MNRLTQGQADASLAMERQSWAHRIDTSLQGASEDARAASGASSGTEKSDSEEGWRLIERALLMGAEVLKSLPRLTN